MGKIEKIVSVFILMVVLLIFSGCTATMPTQSSGVLSANQQRTLNLATDRAIEMANINPERIEGKNVFTDVRGVGAADLGKQHVSAYIKSKMENIGVNAVEEKDASDVQIVFNLDIAGVDTQFGKFLFWRWIDTKAHIDMRLKIINGSVSEKKGVGTASFNQGWFLGLGPTEKLK